MQESSSEGIVGSVVRFVDEEPGADMGFGIVDVGGGDKSCWLEESIPIADMMAGLSIHAGGGILMARSLAWTARRLLLRAPSPLSCAAPLVPSSPFPLLFSSVAMAMVALAKPLPTIWESASTGQLSQPCECSIRRFPSRLATNCARYEPSKCVESHKPMMKWRQET